MVSYNPTLSTDVDWVRFLTGDRVVSPASKAKLTNEEITAVLAEEANKYLAAARCLESLYVQWKAQGADVVEKQVGDLRIRRNDNESAAGAVSALISSLRQRGAWLLHPRPRVFQVL